MIVACEKCGTKFRLDETKIGARGAKVRCSKCSNSFVVQRPSPEPQDATATVTTPGANPAAAPPSPPSNPEGVLPSLPEPPSAQSKPSASSFSLSLEGEHDAKTAVFKVPDELRQRPEPALALDFDDETKAVRRDALVFTDETRSIRPDGTVPPASGGELPPLPGATGSDDLADLPMEDADLISDASAPADSLMLDTSPPGGAAAAESLPPPDTSSDALGLSPPGETTAAGEPTNGAGAFEDPFASAGFGSDGSLSSDGTFSPPEGVDNETLEDPAAASESGRVALARIKPVPKGSAAAARPTSTKPGAKESTRGVALGVKLAMAVMLSIIIVMGVLLHLGGGRLDLSVVGIGEKSSGALSVKARSFKNVFPATLRSVTYPTGLGKEVLVFVGTAINRSKESRKEIAVVAELRDQSGRLVASEMGPLGLALGPGEITQLTDRSSLKNAYEALAKKKGEPSIRSGKTAPFTIVMLQPPPGLSGLKHQVRLKAGEAVLPPPPPPEPVVEEEPEPQRGKGRRKGRKGKRRRGKRKGKAFDEEEG